MRFLLLITTLAVALATGPDAAAQTPADDSNKYQIILLGGSEADYLADWFESDPALRLLASKCHVSRFETGNGLYTRYADQVPPGKLPAVIFARPDSGVIYYASRDTTPISPAQLYSEMGAAYRRAKESPQARTEPSLVTSNLYETDLLRDRIRRPLRDSVLKDSNLRSLSGQLESRLKTLSIELLIGIAIAIAAGIALGNLLVPKK